MKWAEHTGKFLNKIKDGKMTIGKTEITGITDEKRTTFYNFAKELAIAVSDTLEDRFPEFPKLEAFRIFSPVDLRGKSPAALEKYGETEIELLGEHFKNAIIDGRARRLDKESILFQWRRFLAEELMAKIDKDWRPMWEELLNKKVLCARYPDMFFLAMCALVFMFGNASCERGFSVQNRIKAFNQSNMDTDTLDVKMRLAIHAPKSKISDPGAV